MPDIADQLDQLDPEDLSLTPRVSRRENEPARYGTEFDNFFNNTPKRLLKAGIYNEVAVRAA